jgi:hypothetical protein
MHRDKHRLLLMAKKQLSIKQGPPPPPAGISLDGTPLPATAPSAPPDSSAVHAARLLAEVMEAGAFIQDAVSITSTPYPGK